MFILGDLRMLDRTDRRLLRALQQNGAMTAQDMGRHLGLSTSQAGRRRQKLEHTGVLRGVSVDIDPTTCGLCVQAFVTITRARHDPSLMDDFTRLLQTTPEIVSAFDITGAENTVLRIWCSDLDALRALIDQIILPHPMVEKLHTQIVMEQIKLDSPLPL